MAALTLRLLSQEDIIKCDGLNMQKTLEDIEEFFSLEAKGEVIFPSKTILRWGDVKSEETKGDVELDALKNNLHNAFNELVKVAPNLTEEHSGMLTNIQKASRLADRTISLVSVSNSEKQDILEELDIKKRVSKSIKILNSEIQRIKLGEEIQSEVQDEIAKSQREYYLREQMKAIRKELGEDESSVELKELEDKVKSAKMSEDAQKVALKELDRLTKIPTQSPEYSVARTYIEWLADLPWDKSTKDQINIKEMHR